jgi:ligand-binding sensor domain-containing protein
MANLRYLFCLLLLVFAGVVTCYAQTGIKFKHLGINEGLSQNSVFCMLQDYNGFVWIGTEDGLNQYDGYEFTIYKHKNEDKTSLSHSQVNALLEDNQHNLWVGTSGGLNIMDPRTLQFNRIKTSEAHYDENRDFISSLVKDRQGNVWVGTYGGLKMYNKTNNKFLSYNPANQPTANYNLNKIKALYLDKNQTMWVSIGSDLMFYHYRLRFNKTSRCEKAM